MSVGMSTNRWHLTKATHESIWVVPIDPVNLAIGLNALTKEMEEDDISRGFADDTCFCCVPKSEPCHCDPTAEERRDLCRALKFFGLEPEIHPCQTYQHWDEDTPIFLGGQIDRTGIVLLQCPLERQATGELTMFIAHAL